jgi:hypothetical protein
MNRLVELLGIYNKVDQYLESDIQNIVSNAAKKRQLEQYQRINDQAYFVLCWGQLEGEINESCRKAIRKRKSNPDWSKRRAWDLFNPEDKRISGLTFEERVLLVIDKLNNRGAEWKLVTNYYQLRNLIAHGGSHEHRIDVNKIVQDFYKIQAKIVE